MSKRTPIRIMLVLLLMVVIFHLFIITKIIPYDIVWGGQLKSDHEMYVFEVISVFINLFLGFVLLMKGGYIKSYLRQNIINIILWIFLLLFILNTIGNFFAKTDFEKFFAIITMIFALLIGIIIKNKSSNDNLKLHN